MTVKTLTLLKRRPDLDRAAFVTLYETRHARLGERLLAGRAIRYVRRYLLPASDPPAGAVDDDAPDVALEIWYADRAAYETTLAALGAPDVAAEIVADEETLFDRARTRFFLIDERESDLPRAPAG